MVEVDGYVSSIHKNHAEIQWTKADVLSDAWYGNLQCRSAVNVGQYRTDAILSKNIHYITWKGLGIGRVGVLRMWMDTEQTPHCRRTSTTSPGSVWELAWSECCEYGRIQNWRYIVEERSLHHLEERLTNIQACTDEAKIWLRDFALGIYDSTCFELPVRTMFTCTANYCDILTLSFYLCSLLRVCVI